MMISLASSISMGLKFAATDGMESCNISRKKSCKWINGNGNK